MLWFHLIKYDGIYDVIFTILLAENIFNQDETKNTQQQNVW